MVSSAKYHSACGIAAQSRQRPVARRKSAPENSPRRVSSGEEVEGGAESGTGLATEGEARSRGDFVTM